MISRAGRLLGDFLTCIDLGKGPDRCIPLPKHGWNCKDQRGCCSESSYGVYETRNDRGVMLRALSRRIFGSFSPHVGECLAVREGVWMVLSFGVP